MNSQRFSYKLLLVSGMATLLIGGASFLLLSHKPTSLQFQDWKKGEEKKKAGYDQPDEALRFRQLQLQDANGYIPPDGFVKARRHIDLMKAAQRERNKGKKKVVIEAAGIEPDSWEWLGPGNVGGRIRSIVIHPTNTNTMWVGSVSGGIWRTDNGGNSWFPINDFMANLAVSTMVLSPTNTNILYAGTGEGFISTVIPGTGLQVTQGAGIFQSTNGGTTWNQMTNTNPAAPMTPGCGALGAVPCPAFWLYVNRLAISPDGNTILAATIGGIARFAVGGTTWSQQTFNPAMDIDFHPTDSTRAIVGEQGLARFSTDGGRNWTAANFNPTITNGGTLATSGRVELAYAPSNPAIVYASVNQNNGEVYRSTDGGQSYTRVNTGSNFLGSQGWYDNIIWINPQDPAFVIVGGIDLWRSTNSGTNFTQISTWQNAPNSAHSDHHVIVAHPGFNNNTNRIVYFGNDGGIYINVDVALGPFPPTSPSGWFSLNNNLGITQFYGAAGNASSGVIIGGAQDNGTTRFSGNPQGWTAMFGGDGGFCAADPTDANYFYGETQSLGAIVRSTNGGVNASVISSGIGDVGQANFIAPFILDPNNPNRMLAGGISLWRSTNVKAATPTWAAIKVAAAGNSPVSAIAVSPSNSSLICVGHNSGDIFLTFNGTDIPPLIPAWAQIDTAALPNRFVTRLVIDPSQNPNWIYATFGGFNGDNLYRTTDWGNTWTDITGTGPTGLPNVPVRSLTFHPRMPDLLYAATEIGIFTSSDAGANWEPTQDGPANVSVDDLFWMNEDLIAVTHGRGLYRASGGVYVDCNWNGIQAGTFFQPFKTVAAAIASTTRYRTIWLKPCSYNEQFRLPNNAISKRLEIRSLGGTAAIGSQP